MRGGRDVWRRAPGPGRPCDAARCPLTGAGDVPGTGLVGCPSSQTGVSASSGTGHSRRRDLLPPRERGGRGREELPWPCADYWPPSPCPQRPGTTGLTQHHSMGPPNGVQVLGMSTRMGPGESIPVTLGCPRPPVRWDTSGTSASQEPHQETQVALPLLAEGRILAEPWAHPVFCTCGQSTATTAGGVQPCPAPKTPPSPIPTCLSFTLSHCLQEEMPFKGRYFKRNGRSLLSKNHSASLLPIPSLKPGVRFTWG